MLKFPLLSDPVLEYIWNGCLYGLIIILCYVMKVGEEDEPKSQQTSGSDNNRQV